MAETLEQYDTAEVEAAQAAYRLEEASGRCKKLDQLLDGVDRLQVEKRKLIKLQEAAALALRIREEKHQLTFHGEPLFLASQAGLLAESLEEGMPCPVCGSTHHPQLATPQEGAPTQAVLNKMKSELQSAEEEAARRAQASGQQVTRVETLGDTLYEQAGCFRRPPGKLGVTCSFPPVSRPRRRKLPPRRPICWPSIGCGKRES
jgi:exonuclease SbcC